MRITSISFVSIIVALAVAHHPTFAIEKGVAEVNDDNNNNHNLLRQNYLQRCPALGDKCTDRKPCCLDSKLSCNNGICESSVSIEGQAGGDGETGIVLIKFKEC